ncbi:MAG: DUF2721 domain-containing protein [Gammaproteobacteria bacterium]|nr:DUF2721 domain-containing protein [Gammaproteobacteria bacterium]
MQFNITTPALLFPAITLLLLAYSSRFQGLASIIRTLCQKLASDDQEGLIRQIAGLRVRLKLIRGMQTFGMLSLLGCILSMIMLFLHCNVAAPIMFAVSLVLMVISLIFSLWEVLISGNALEIELEHVPDPRKRK